MAIYDYKILMDGCISRANKAIANDDKKAAETLLMEATEYALKLALQKMGKPREEMYKKAQELKELTKFVREKAIEEERLRNIERSYPSSTDSSQKKSFSDDDRKPKNEDNTAQIHPQIATAPETEDKQKNSKKENVEIEQTKDEEGQLRLADFYGQPKAVTAISYAIATAQLQNTALPHMLLFGSHGLGKTTLANIVANEMGSEFTEMSAYNMTPEDLVAVLQKLKKGDILYIDEIHTLPKIVAENVLYSALQDFKITFTDGKGADATPTTVKLNHFTLIGATTEIGLLPKPLTQRMSLQCRLVAYSKEVIANIVQCAFAKKGLIIDADISVYIASRARNNPRVAKGITRGIADMAIFLKAKEMNITEKGSLRDIKNIRLLNITITEEIANRYFDENGIDKLGLESGDIEYLKTLIFTYKGGPASLQTMAKTLNESVNVISDKYEDFLIRIGMIAIGGTGRTATDKAFEHLGVPQRKLPNAPTDSDKKSIKGESEQKVDLDIGVKKEDNSETTTKMQADTKSKVEGDLHAESKPLVETEIKTETEADMPTETNEKPLQ